MQARGVLAQMRQVGFAAHHHEPRVRGMVRHEGSAQRVVEQPAGEVLDARQVEAACARKVAHECLVRCHVEENAPLKGQPFNGTRLSRSQTTRSSPFKGGMISRIHPGD